MKGEIISDSSRHAVCVFVSLNLLYMIIYSLCKLKGYSFDESASSSRCTQYFVCLSIQYFCYLQFQCSSDGTAMKRIFAGHILRLRFGLHFHNDCFDIDETWCVDCDVSDEPCVPPSSNCLHHQSDCKLTNSAGHQLAKRLQPNRKAGRDDGIIRYLCLLLCLVQRGVAHNSGSWYSVYHLLRYKGW